jgi:hypothetical protein
VAVDDEEPWRDRHGGEQEEARQPALAALLHGLSLSLLHVAAGAWRGPEFSERCSVTRRAGILRSMERRIRSAISDFFSHLFQLSTSSDFVITSCTVIKPQID